MDSESKLKIEWEAYKGIYDHFQSFAFKNGGFTSVILGWLYTSSSAREFIGDNFIIACCAVVGILVYTGFHFYWCHRGHQRSNQIQKRFNEMNSLSTDIIESYHITEKFWMSVAVLHLILCLGIAIVVMSLGFGWVC